MVGLPGSDVQQAALGTRRLVQDFVTAPLPLTAVLPVVAVDPSPLPAMVTQAATRGGPEGGAAEAPVVLVVDARQLHDGWSAHLTWSDFIGGVPPFDGELVILGADPHRTWIALEGTVRLASHADWSDAPLRLARLEIREFLNQLAQVVSASPGS